MSDGTVSKRRRRWINVALAATSVAVTLLLLAGIGEIAVRYHERHRTTVPGTMPLLYYRHARLGYALVRGSDYFGWVHVNGQGFRGTRPTSIDTMGVFRVMVVGASTAFDIFVTRDERAWPSQLEAWLATRLNGRRVEVINASVPGYVLDDNIIRFRTELAQFHPDLLILFHGHNELFRSLRSATGAAHSPSPTPAELQPATPWAGWLEQHSLLYAKLLARWSAIRWVSTGREAAAASGLTASNWQATLTGSAEGFRQDLDDFLAVAASHHTTVALLELVHITPPDARDERDPEVANRWHFTVPTASPEIVLEGYRRYNAVIREEGARLGVPVVLSTAFGLSGRRWYAEGDPIHFNDAGAAKMAEATGQALLDAHLVPSGPVTPAPASRHP